MLSQAIAITLEAGKILEDYFFRDLKISTKTNDRDLVTQADLESEKRILTLLKRHFPSHAILSEEEGELGSSDYLWIVDPLDGTTNFAHKNPIFCVALALVYKGEVLLAATFDPLRNELFSAEKGKGAKLNDKKIEVSKINKLAQALVATGFPYSRATNPDNNSQQFTQIMPLVQGIRRSGSAALDLAYVACNRLDGYWEGHLKPWDIAGGGLLIQEAGGIFRTVENAPWTVKAPSVIGGNKKIFQALLKILQK